MAGKVDWERLGRSLTAWLREMRMKAVMRWEASCRQRDEGSRRLEMEEMSTEKFMKGLLILLL